MKTFIGMGHGNDIEAVRQATKGLTDPKMILFMAPYDNVKSVAKLINEIYPDAQSIGTIGTKFVNGKIDDKSIMVLGFFDDTKTSCGVITEISKCPVLSVAQINKKMAQVEAKQDDTVSIARDQKKCLLLLLIHALERKKFHSSGERSLECRMEKVRLWLITAESMRMHVYMHLLKI